jgi:prepilin-type N-terminal cleavage/methylation domain-containing protein
MIKKGFTLVELMVVVGILSIIMLVISQPLASIIKYQRESQIQDNMRDNLQFVINKIEKELKTSSGVAVIPGGAGLTFRDQNGGLVTYSLNNNEILKNSTRLTENTIFRVMNLRFWENTTTNLTTMSIEAESLDNRDSVTMQVSVFPLND